MASRIKPRSVKDATRFTSTVPHASSRIAASPAQKIQEAKAIVETPEQRVTRLRKAHIAAQQVQLPLLDRIIVGSRPYLDIAHRWTVRFLIFFTIVASVLSAYSVWDMVRFNRARRAEWIEAQKQLEADALSAARVAYLKGEATEEQILLVEEATREAEAQGAKLPPLLSQPKRRTHFEEKIKPLFEDTIEEKKENKNGKGILGVVYALFGVSQDGGKEPYAQETANLISDQAPAGPESRALASSVEASAAEASTSLLDTIKGKALTAWELEKENQRKGGSLDKLGLENDSTPYSEGTSTSPPEGKKRSWWPW